MSDLPPRSGAARAPMAQFRRSIFRVLLLSVLLMVAGFLFFALSIEPREHVDPVPADGIVVLTGGADRIRDALDLLARGKGRRLLISGVNTHSTKEDFRRRWPGHDHAFACCVDLDYQARNTHENAVESARWAQKQGFRSVLLVTASYHMPRALLEFEQALPGVALHAYPVVPEASRLNRWWTDPALVRIMALEFIKYWGASLRLAVGIPAG